MKKLITDLWYQPINENEIAIMIEDENGHEWEICELDITNYDSDIYNECLTIAQEMGYVLEGECYDLN